MSSPNLDAARSLVRAAAAVGVEEFCVCAGSRNSPLLAVLGVAQGLRLWSHFEERSAAFFALGRARLTGRPVAIVTTSGTAAAELLPAAIEAHYSGVPLLLLTADRPARYRGSGAPQAIEQRGLFGPYVEESLDIDATAAADVSFLTWSLTRPLHVNVAFDEPLIDGEVSNGTPAYRPAPPARGRRSAEERAGGRAVADFLRRASRPLVLAGGLEDEDGPRTGVFGSGALRHFLLQLAAPVFAEALSGFREDAELAPLLVRSGERMLARGQFDAVLRIGAVPTARFWRDLDERLVDLPLLSVTPLGFSGLSRGEVIAGDVGGILAAASVEPRPPLDGFFDEDARRAGQLETILAEEPESEPALLRALSAALPDAARVYLGNSLPIREWELAALRSRPFVYGANRGANGIDGQLSTFLGWSAPGSPNVAVVGDLTAMYDLAAPWIARQLDAATAFTLVVVNNGGGRIFGRVPSLAPLPAAVRENVIENGHSVRLDGWAAMWGLPYTSVRSAGDVAWSGGRGIVELLPDRDATQRFWRRYDALWSRS